MERIGIGIIGAGFSADLHVRSLNRLMYAGNWIYAPPIEKAKRLIKATIITSDCVLGGVRNKLDICLSNAYISCNMSPNTCCEVFAPDKCVFQDEYITEKTETKAGWSFPSPDEDWVRGYPQEMEDFIESVVLDRDPISDGDLAKQVVEVIYSSYLSAEEGSEVEIAKVLDRAV